MDKGYGSRGAIALSFDLRAIDAKFRSAIRSGHAADRPPTIKYHVRQSTTVAVHLIRFSMHTPTEVEWTAEQIANFWDYQSRRPSIERQYFSAGHGKWIARRSLKYLSHIRQPRILDLGCGTGHFLTQLARMRPGTQLHGVDFSPRSIERSRATTAKIQPLPDLRTIGHYPTPFADRSMDMVFVIEVVEHLSDDILVELVDEARRLLAPRGMLVVTTPNREDLELLHTCCPQCNSTFHIWQHLRSWSVSTLRDFMASRGLQQVVASETRFESPLVRMVYRAAGTVGLTRRPPPHLLGIYRRQD